MNGHTISSPGRILVLFLLLSALIVGAAPAAPGQRALAAGPATPPPRKPLAQPTLPPKGDGIPAAAVPLRPAVTPPMVHDLSPALRDLPPLKAPARAALRQVPVGPLPKNQRVQMAAPTGADPLRQERAGALAMPAPTANFEGLGNLDYLLPPDTQGDIGYDPASGRKYYVQWVNVSFAIWDVTVTPTLKYGPVAGNTIWQGLGGGCDACNDGDPITLYDPLAQRWLMSQFALPNYPNGPFYEYIAISQSADPLGPWYRYAYAVHATVMNDYPKFGVWPDAYYMTANQFLNGSDWAGAGVFAFDRAKMLQGQPAAMVSFDLYSANPNFGGMLPADLDGSTPPPPGAPGIYAEVDMANVLGDAQATMRLWEFHVDWANPANATFGLNGQPNALLPVADYAVLCPTTTNCIPQPGTGQGLDAIADRLMHRLAYRNYGDHEALTVNHTVTADAGRAGIRWYELRKTDDAWNLYQQGTYAPADTESRWMGSLAMDHVGNMALGYSVSSASVYPSVRYTGRLVSDPLGQMAQGEALLVAGGGSQTSGYARWGDYSMMGVDPLDDCTFWYTQEYYAATSDANWQTRIGSFHFPSCSVGPQGTLAGSLSDAATHAPVVGARVEASSGPTFTLATTSGAEGSYALPLPPGSYGVSASAYGYKDSSISGITVAANVTTTRDIVLASRPMHTVSLAVYDAVAGWPLYAHITIRGDPLNPPAPAGELWTDPATGVCSTTLAEGITYTLEVNAMLPGYVPLARTFGPLAGNATQKLALQADAASCTAPGYRPTYLYLQDFEATDGGYGVSGTAPSWSWGEPVTVTAHSGVKVWATDLTGDYYDSENSTLTSPVLDLSGHPGKAPVLEWWQWLQTELNYDIATVEVSQDGGTTWAPVYSASGDADLAWARHSVLLGSDYAVAGFKVRFHLASDSSVTRPGWYVDDVAVGLVDAPPASVSDFEANNGGYTISGTVTSWAWGQPVTITAHSGSKVWATNLAGDYGNHEDGSILSPAVDLSAYHGRNVVLSWWQVLRTEEGYDFAAVDVSRDGGTTWATIYQASGDVDPAWAPHYVVLDPVYAVHGFRVRFHFTSDLSNPMDGWAIDDVSIRPVASVNAPCVPQAGGLVVGVVRDTNTHLPLDGATVADDNGGTATSAATPDPALAGGFYALFTPALDHVLTATMPLYGPAVAQVRVVQSDTVRQDLALPTGQLVYRPSSLEATASAGERATLTLDLSNIGSMAASFEIIPLDSAIAALGPREKPSFVVKPFRQEFKTTQGLNLAPQPSAPGLAAGRVLRSWGSGLGQAWGVAAAGGAVWVSSPAPAWSGTDTFYAYTPGGLPLGHMRQTLQAATSGPADLAYVPVSGMLWAVSTRDGDHCIHEFDPAGGYTGRTICPGGPSGFAVSQRGLAYDPFTDTWFAGGWNERLVHHFDAAGRMLDEVNVGLNISGLAYNPATQHLFAMTNADPTAVYVLDAAHRYALLGQFTVPGFSRLGGAGLEMDCAGNLWAVDQATQRIYEIESGETSTCARAVPWLNTVPVSGTVAAGASRPITVTLYAAPGMALGIYSAQLKVIHDTPYIVESIPVTMTISPFTYGVQLSPSAASQAGSAGSAVTYTLAITNTGNTTDTFGIALAGNAWPVAAPASIGPLAAGRRASLPVTVTIPAGAVPGAQDVVTVTITSGGNARRSAAATLRTGVRGARIMLPLVMRGGG